MRPVLNRVLMAYRPLYMNGLLRDGQYRLPKAVDPSAPRQASAPRRGMLVVLTRLLHVDFRHRSKS